MTNQLKEQPTDKRLIEDFLPIEAISATASREKKHPRQYVALVHYWPARRPITASRAAVFSALVHAGTASSTFVTDLCTYPGPLDKIREAEGFILQQHAERMSNERREKITVEDIKAGRVSRPRVLDMFAGGGAIPLEALRLGCEAYALDLNPVAHLIELCTLVYPEKYGQPDPAVKGSSKDKTWAGLAAEVEYWGNWVQERVRKEIGDLYPPIPIQKTLSGRSSGGKRKNAQNTKPDHDMRESNGQYVLGGGLIPGGLDDADTLSPVAYVWTRTVICRNPDCRGLVPLARQTWLARNKNRMIAAEPLKSPDRQLRYRLLEDQELEQSGFNPSDLSVRGSAACVFCTTLADDDYVKSEAQAGRMGAYLLAVVCSSPSTQGKMFIVGHNADFLPQDSEIHARLDRIIENGLFEPLHEPLRGKLTDQMPLYGMTKFGDIFTPRQQLALAHFSASVRAAYQMMIEQGITNERALATASVLTCVVNKLADSMNSLCRWESTDQITRGSFSRQALGMVWDFSEINPFAITAGSFPLALQAVTEGVAKLATVKTPATVLRGTATSLPFDDSEFDAIITDPPYYHNIYYADISDFFYIWAKRMVGRLYPEHFSSQLAPKRNEAVAQPSEHGGSMSAAKEHYEKSMTEAFKQAYRVLKSNAPLVCVYAHKTTKGWATLVDALRQSGFVITEAWPVETESSARSNARDTAALASSIFLVARRREGNETGLYENDVQPELQTIVRERVDTLWSKGVTGADLVIACVGGGLRAFTRFARVEYANGEEVPADKFLTEVEGAVLETLLEKLFGLPRSGVSVVDPATRFYVLWRFAYRSAAIEAGEAIIFAYPQGVELDGAHGVSQGARALVEREKNKYRLRDFTERGENEKLGLAPDGNPTPLIDVLHRTLWLMENEPHKLADFLGEARPNLDHLRVVAETLAGAKLAGNGSGGGRSLIASRGEEAAALRKLTTNWRAVVEANAKPLI